MHRKYIYPVSTLIILLGLGGGFLFIRNLIGGLFQLGTERFFEIKDYFITLVTLITASLLHESGHGLMAFLFTSEFPKVKFGFSGPFSVIPSLKTDLSITYMLGKTQAILIFMAGVLIDFFTLGLLSEVFMFHREPYLIFSIYALIAGIIMNLIPFWKSDGYYLFSTVFDKPNLIESSISELKRFFKTGRGNIFEVAFGLAHVLFRLVLLIFFIYFPYKIWGIIGLKISLFIFFIYFFYYFIINFLEHFNAKRR